MHGRGGQGTVTLADLVAIAGFYMGYESQSFPSFGVERRGAPVTAFVRLSDEPIRLREQIYDVDYLIIQDSGLLGLDKTIEQGLRKAKAVIVNADKGNEALDGFDKTNIFFIPATDLALKIIGKPFVNTILLGAFGAVSGLLNLESMKAAIKEKIKKEVVDLNIKALEAAYDYVKKIKES